MPAEPTPTTLTAEPGSNGQHFSIDVKFPIYSIQFVSEKHVVLAGGGGSSRTGVKNRLVRLSLYFLGRDGGEESGGRMRGGGKEEKEGRGRGGTRYRELECTGYILIEERGS